MQFKKEVIAILMGLALIVALVLLLTWPTMMLWNWLMPSLFNQPKLDFLQTFGLMTLAKLMFGVTSK